MPVAEPAYDCVDCGRTHVASLWDVRQVSPVGLVMKTESLFGDAHRRLGPTLRYSGRFSYRSALHGGPAHDHPLSQTGPGGCEAQAHAAEANVGRVVEAHRVVLISSMSP